MSSLKQRRGIIFIITVMVVSLLCFLGISKKVVVAKVEWEVLKDIILDESPKDIAMTSDDSTAYILSNNEVLIFSFQEDKVVDRIPIKEKFSKIALSNSEDKLFLLDAKSKRLTAILIEQIHDIEIGKSPIIGDPNAPVNVVVFFDFQCPHCANTYSLLEQLHEKYPKDIKLITKHFPLRSHKFARKAAIASLAASKQKKYREISDIFFQNFRKLNDETIKQYSEEIGLDMEEFNKALNDTSLDDIVNFDVKQGIQLKVQGVPTIFINGRRVKNRSLDAMSEMIEKELTE